MTGQTEGERLLAERWRDPEDLRREFPYMADSLGGGFATDSFGKKEFNVYEGGKVVSRTLIQFAARKNPTVGVILPGAYAFPTGNNAETLTVLEGELEAAVDNGPFSRLKRDGAIIAPAGTTLSLKVGKEWMPCFYICRYEPKSGGAGEQDGKR